MSPHPDQHPMQLSATSLPSGKAKPYKSPPRKLTRFFEKSRNQWKAKYLEAKAGVKRLQNGMRFLERSKEGWKTRVSTLEVELSALKAHIRAQDKELEA
jgi:hypothetical protein